MLKLIEREREREREGEGERERERVIGAELYFLALGYQRSSSRIHLPRTELVIFSSLMHFDIPSAA